jgi:hypothetical protein
MKGVIMKRSNPVKEELKKMAEKLRQIRIDIAETQKKGEYAGYMQSEQRFLKFEFRHRHIAYCMLRGRSYEQIERKFREGHEPDMNYVEKLQEQFKTLLEGYYENVHSRS